MTIELEQEDDGRWIAEAPEIPGALAYSDFSGPQRLSGLPFPRRLNLLDLAKIQVVGQGAAG